MKKIIAIMLAVSLLTVFAIPANAAETSGKCGENVTYTLVDDIVHISGTGPMYNYTPENPSPFRQLRNKTCYFVIEEGVTTIGDYAFAEDSFSGYIISVAGSVTKVGHKAFANNPCQVTFLGNPPTLAEDACENMPYGTFGYIGGWEETDLQSYGGKPQWKKLEIVLTGQTKTVYSLNEEIKPTDFIFKLSQGRHEVDTFSPPTVQLEDYDNSTYGEKTVKVVAYDLEFTHTYFVSDGQNHLTSAKVEPIGFQYYTGREIKIEPVVKAGDLVLTKDVHYSLSYQNNINAGTDAKVTVTGIGVWEGFSKTLTFPILRRDISECNISGGRVSFSGSPVTPTLDIFYYSNGAHYNLKAGVDYVLYLHNNINLGEGSYYIVGIGNFCGYATGKIEIFTSKMGPYLKGAFNGYVNGELNDEVYYKEAVISPSAFTASINSAVGSITHKYYAFFELYRVVGEELVFVTSEETEYGYGSFSYDFSFVYEEAAEEGGAVYVLSYAWVDSEGRVFSGIYSMLIPAKVLDATTMEVELVEGIDDFRRAYLCAYGLDGNVGDAVWTTSDSSVATVEGGVVTFKEPGNVKITAQYGDLTDYVEFIVTADDLSLCDIITYNPQTGKADVYYNGILLKAGTDYVLTASENAGVVSVTATGCGLFTGQIVREFRVGEEELVHTHNYSDWTEVGTGHQQTCAACGDVKTGSHNWGNRRLIKQANCKEGGQCQYTCSDCYATKIEETPKTTDHKYGAWTEAGTVYQQTCSVCGDVKTGSWHTDAIGDYFMEDGVMAKNCWRQDSKGLRYIGADGYVLCNKQVRTGEGEFYTNAEGYRALNDWVEDEAGRFYVDGNNRRVYNKWILHNGSWYYLDANGYAVVNSWRKDSKGWCYLGADGVMATNSWVPDSKGLVYVAADGYMVSNKWVQDENGWRYAGSDGYLVRNKWQKDSKGWCYLGSEGYMVTDNWVPDSKGLVYVGSNGYMVVNQWVADEGGLRYVGSDGYIAKNCWQKRDGKWSYIDSDGYIATGCWKKDSKGWCYLDEEGYMVTNNWVPDSKDLVYVGSNGYMVYNKWIQDSNGWRYAGADGYVVRNKWQKDSIGWCYLGADGYMVVNKWVPDSKGLVYVGSNGYMVVNKWIEDETGWRYAGPQGYYLKNRWQKDSKGWCYLQDDGYMVVEGWVKDSVGWCYLDASGYWDGKYFDAPPIEAA